MSRNIISYLRGGIGNQMFQYAAGYALAKERQANFYISTDLFQQHHQRQYSLDKLSISAQDCDFSFKKFKRNYINRLLRKFYDKGYFIYEKNLYYYYLEKQFHHDNNLTNIKSDHIILDGYFQSEKYFNHYKSDIKKQFTLMSPLSEQFLLLQDKIKQEKSTVAIHIRRTDYINHPVMQLCAMEYYLKAIKLVKAMLDDDPTYIIFSDDIEYAKNELKQQNDNFIFIEPNQTKDYEQLFLISQCSHMIMSNSSYSWWGNWLNQYDDKITIAPLHWFTPSYRIINSPSDLYPNGAILLQ